jgi:hypothetical protein
MRLDRRQQSAGLVHLYGLCDGQPRRPGGRHRRPDQRDRLCGLSARPAADDLNPGTLYKIYLRENVYDWYVTDDFRVAQSDAELWSAL